MKTPQLKAPRATPGFSLVELLVVVTIIVLLTGLTLGAMGWVQKKAAVDKARANLALIENALEQYKADTGSYPVGNTSQVVYQALFGDEDLNGKPDEGRKVYLSELDPSNTSNQLVDITKKTILDSWGREWQYLSGSEYKAQMFNPDFDMYSFGPDGKDESDEDKADNIKNW